MLSSILLIVLLVADVTLVAAFNNFTYASKVYENALPIDVFDKLMNECLLIDKYIGMVEEKFEHGKRATFWFPTTQSHYRKGKKYDTKARLHIEEAIFYLKKYLKLNQGMMKHGKSTCKYDNIAGAEWWVQVRTGGESIGFHYDKDEALASTKGVMKHPAISTVTYLSDIGAPTMILNQTTPDGNREIPDIPEEAYLVYPKSNNHLLFNGNLQHGVISSAASRTSSTSIKKRVTLLINWWCEKPGEPNAIFLTPKIIQKMGLAKTPAITGASSKMAVEVNNIDVSAYLKEEKVLPDSKVESEMNVNGLLQGIDQLDEKRREKLKKGKAEEEDSARQLEDLSGQPSPIASLAIPDRNSAKRHQIEIPPGDLLFFYLPQSMKSSGSHYISWKQDESYGAIGMLNLFNTNQVGAFFRSKIPNMMLLYNNEDKYLYLNILDAVLPFAKKYVGKVKFYFCPNDQCGDAIKAFGLYPNSDLPRLVIDWTQENRKLVQRKEDFAPTFESIENFYNSSFVL